ncbi:hypothetical protein POX_c03927 [Penicillium oxalicum]|uniref:hypothetical protein n=1 Tax=Penicillium oxalicum TaxID=69781 RepID=UPI0020B719A5|nr:hypothetical protein POX_c03927 [Penicillium oxalicum]KAI2791072.1 hypothetical protein POX_c03927 [Penicillium oxalicum]
MNKSCVACAASKIRCDVKQKGSPCSRCLQKGSPCVRAGRKQRPRRSTKSRSTQSPQTGGEDVPYHSQSPDWAALNVQHDDLSFLATPPVDGPDFFSQLADLENMVDMSSWSWNPDGQTSTSGDITATQSHPTALVSSPIDSELSGSCEGLICPDNFRLPAEYTLELESLGTIPVLRLETYAKLFFSHFYPFLPLLHIPTFCLARASGVLLRTICFIGAGFGSHPSSTADAKLLYGSLPSILAKSCLRTDGRSPTFEELQALVLLQFAIMANGEVAQRAASRLLHPLLIAAIRQAGFLKIHGECSKAARNARSWEAWIRKESEKRVMWGSYAVDCYQSILCGSKPLLSPTDTRASFPCNDPSWNAYSASSWAQLPAQDPSSCFLSSVRGLLVGQVTSTSHVTTFGLNLLVLAMHSLLLEAQTSILPVDVSALERGLQTWYGIWKQFTAPSADFSNKGAGNILISNSLSLYRLAVYFLRNGRPVLNEAAYMGQSTNAGNPLIINEHIYQCEMMRFVQQVLSDFQNEEQVAPMVS